MQLRHDEIRQKYGETHLICVWYEWVDKCNIKEANFAYA